MYCLLRRYICPIILFPLQAVVDCFERKPRFVIYANSADAIPVPQNAASDQAPRL